MDVVRGLARRTSSRLFCFSAAHPHAAGYTADDTGAGAAAVQADTFRHAVGRARRFSLRQTWTG